MNDEEICTMIYQSAAAVEPTGDVTRWPDVLAFKYPITALKPLLQLMGFRDARLLAIVVQSARSLPRNTSREDVTTFKNVLAEALAEQHRLDDA